MSIPNVPQPITSTQLRVPITDDTMEGLKIENALLMRRNILLLTRDIKLRTALELATGVPWDSDDFVDLSGDALEEVVAQNLAHGLRLPINEARKRVRQNRTTANPSQVEKPVEDEVF